jgi:UDP-N-acetylmuramate--alanine ligase
MSRIHLMGIGGVGVSALARVYMARGDDVSGCDLRDSDTLQALAEEGIRVSVGHDPEHVLGADILVYSGAVRSGATEVEAAHAMGVHVLSRAEALAELIAETDSIAITGSAGKTTITHMLGSILLAAGWDPTVLVGDGVNARAGRSRWLVAEADESDRSLILHHPRHALLSNVDFDHPDHFDSVADVAGIFEQFLNNLPPDGLAVVCADDEIAAALATTGRRVTYGFSEEADYRCGEERPFPIWRRGEELGRVRLEVPGRHNVLNATGAAALALELGVEFGAVARALEDFTGAHRRMERLGWWQGAVVYDDYAHHPTKVRAALAAARELRHRRLIAVFQPHRYTRLAALLDDFARSFDLADAVLVTDVYGAGEENLTGITGESLAARMRNARYTPDFASARAELAELVGRDDLVLFMGAGDIWKLGRELAVAG